MLWLLALCSIVTLGYALERLVALRRERVIPRDFVNRFLERLSSGKLDRDRAAELCQANDSPVARVFAHGRQLLGPARRDDPPGDRLRRRRRGHRPEAERPRAQRHGDARPAARPARHGHRHDPVVRRPRRPGRHRPRARPWPRGSAWRWSRPPSGLAIAVVSVAAYYYLLNRVDLLVRDLDDNARKVIDLVSAEAIRPASGDRRPSFVRARAITHPPRDPRPRLTIRADRRSDSAGQSARRHRSEDRRRCSRTATRPTSCRTST